MKVPLGVGQLLQAVFLRLVALLLSGGLHLGAQDIHGRDTGGLVAPLANEYIQAQVGPLSCLLRSDVHPHHQPSVLHVHHVILDTAHPQEELQVEGDPGGDHQPVKGLRQQILVMAVELGHRVHHHIVLERRILGHGNGIIWGFHGRLCSFSCSI